MKRPTQPISLAGFLLVEVRHICAFFSDDEEEYRTLLPFILEGLSYGNKALHVIDPESRPAHLHRLAEAAVDSVACQQSGQLQIRDDTDVYLQNGHFDQGRMLAAFKEIANSGRGAEGFPLSRIVCRMDWTSTDQSLIKDVIEFESRVNDVWRSYDDVVICTYCLANLTGGALIDIMRTHPMVILGGQVHRNPFFTPPDEFLHDFIGRRTESTTQ